MASSSETPAAAIDSGGTTRPKLLPLSERLRRRFFPETIPDLGDDPLGKLTPRLRAQLLYEYCLASEKKVSETVHSLFIIAEHYFANNPDELENTSAINGIPPFFAALTAEEKANYCYNQVTESLSLEAMPVTVESLRATKRSNPNDPWSSYAGRFVRQVTRYVVLSLIIMLGLYLLLDARSNFFDVPEGTNGLTKGMAVQWIAFGCLGALVHLLNHALTATRLQTFEVSEARKIFPRLLLGGMFGFIVPWVLVLAEVPVEKTNLVGPVTAFFGGYSVRFSIGLLERLLAAVFPDGKSKG